ncbi:hypothetical protein Taro_055429 [Colocasia esculenta]|uniref:Plant disease resistance WDH domain-containing protein n=1 Tax=Colocasia esculenta TaxID=4460 RepID=A0A843XQZ1_COLES|nr:hypothetical protein [Colocasia esculenta]
MQQPRSSSLADAPRRSVGNRPRPPMAPLGRSRLADTSTSRASASRDASGRLTSTTHLAVASSSSVPGGKILPLGENSGRARPPESRPLPPQSTSRSVGGHMLRQPPLEDHLYDADASSGGHSDGYLADRRKLSSVSARIKCCDVYIGMCGHEDPSLLRFVSWLRAELQLHGVMCFASDRSTCTDVHAHCVAREAIDSATLGVVVITTKTFSSPYGMEDLKLFLERRNLVAVFFGITQEECLARDIIEKRGELWQEEGGLLWDVYGGLEEEWKEAVNSLSCLHCRLEAHTNNWRDCILDTVVIVGRKLGRKGVIDKVKKWKETVAGIEFPFPRNDSFVGREKELLELELVLFGYLEEDEHPEMRPRRSFGRSLITENTGGRRSLDLKGKEKEPLLGKGFLEEREMEGRRVERVEYIIRGRERSGRTETTSPANGPYGKGIACICGKSGIGKTELVLEFTYRLAQRYKMVLWIGGSEELEEKAMYRVRKELMRDIPFLVVIDNLEGEKDWWDERNLMKLLPPFEALVLMKGSLENLSREEVSALKVIEVKISRIPLGLAIVRGILSELLDLCFAILDLGGRHGNLASRMVQACGWFAPSPVPGPLLVAVASSVPQECESDNIWKRLVHAVPCVRMSHYKQLEAKAMDILIRYGAALELLHHAMKALEAVKPPQPSEARTLEQAPRWRISKERPSMQSESHLYVEFSAMQAILLETISKLMHASSSGNQ